MMNSRPSGGHDYFDNIPRERCMVMRVSHLLPIDVNQAHLWRVNPESIKDDGVLRSFVTMLSNEERERQRKFIFEKDRHLYLVAHAFVRFCLSRYADVEPERWIFRKNRYGKPFIDNSIYGLPLQFNLSHTHGYITCAITVQHQVGVDVERIEWDESKMGIAERYFSNVEYDDLRSLPHNIQAKRFFHYWTLKEAYVKAKGMGLSLPLDSFYFICDEYSPKIFFRNAMHDRPDGWSFFLNELDDMYMCAVAVECGEIPCALIIHKETDF
jgi:4'-phosphopantetheinyl transferase